jgi:dUTP pyrophosphatase
MEKLVIQILKLREDAILPQKAHEDDAGYDLYACAEIVIPAGESRLIPTGLALGLPPMTEAQIRPRSGLALNHQITVLNTPGTIDAGYRGEVGVILINHAKEAFEVHKGMKIAQMIVSPVLAAELSEVTDLDETTRGSGGFGSTG